MNAPRRVVIGIGNPDRGDDAAGRLVTQRLAALLTPHPVPPPQRGRERRDFRRCIEPGRDVAIAHTGSNATPPPPLRGRAGEGGQPAPSDDILICESDGEATALLALMERAAAVWLVDACASGAPAGTIRRFDAAARSLPAARFGMSTHGFGLHEAIELARTLGTLPPACIVCAVEGMRFDIGSRVSPAVAAAVDALAACLAAELGTGGPPGR